MTKLAFVCRRAAAAAGVAGAAFAVVACGASPAATSNGALATSVVAVVVAGAQAIFAWRQAGIQDAQRYATAPTRTAVLPRRSAICHTGVLT
jgi:D-serine deaminase-like pyridoxal phosphate-dependent protein